MVQHDCGEIPVVDAAEQVVGVVTDRDIVCRVVAEGQNPSAYPAEHCMTSRVVTVTEDAIIAAARDLLERMKIVVEPSAATVLAAIRRGLVAQTGSDQLDGRRVGVIGLGKVGGALAAQLVAEGARVVGCDLDYERCEAFAAEHGNEVSPSAEATRS